MDEAPRIVVEHGPVAERQLRATVQGHRHTGYVFAGSDTRLLTERTEDPDRPFCRLGARIFDGEIPRDVFEERLIEGFESTGMAVDDGAMGTVLDRASEVPYNVQRLAHEVWERLRVRDEPRVTDEEVEAAWIRRSQKM